MVNIPTQLYSKEIIDLIKYQLSESEFNCFNDFDEIHKDSLISYALKELNYDIEVTLSQEANEYLSKYLLEYDRDYLIEFNKLARYEYCQYFENYFDQMIYEIKNEIECDQLKEDGFTSYIDRENGETQWRRMA